MPQRHPGSTTCAHVRDRVAELGSGRQRALPAPHADHREFRTADRAINISLACASAISPRTRLAWGPLSAQISAALVWSKDGQNDDVASRGRVSRVRLYLVDNQIALTHKVAASRVFLALRAEVGPIPEPSSHIAKMLPACPPPRCISQSRAPRNPAAAAGAVTTLRGTDYGRLSTVGMGAFGCAVEFIEPGFQDVVVYALPRCDFLPRPFNLLGPPTEHAERVRPVFPSALGH